MPTEPKMPNRYNDAPRDKPFAERTEHANLERPGAQAHPKAARGWGDYVDPATAWRMR
ncbi:MAG TPA: hypothetical protein VMZ74_05635 [Ramlibacter sp.]|nr:hypothetical protein [Ramlibacter sp.]